MAVILEPQAIKAYVRELVQSRWCKLPDCQDWDIKQIQLDSLILVTDMVRWFRQHYESESAYYLSPEAVGHRQLARELGRLAGKKVTIFRVVDNPQDWGYMKERHHFFLLPPLIILRRTLDAETTPAKTEASELPDRP